MIRIKLARLFSPNLFIDLDKIDPDEEGLLDYCPKCELRLPDRKVLTFKRHEKEVHEKRTDQQLANAAFKSGSMPFIFAMIALWGSLGIILVVGPMVFDYLDEIDGHTLENECFRTAYELRLSNYENQQFVQSDIETLNWLGLNCGMSMSVWPTDGDSDPEPFEKTMFGNEEAYESHIEYLEENGYR